MKCCLIRMLLCGSRYCSFFFFNDTATTEIYTLSLHDALPICPQTVSLAGTGAQAAIKLSTASLTFSGQDVGTTRSEEHTSELQSRLHLVCRLLLEKKKLQTQDQELYHGPPALLNLLSTRPTLF